MAARGSLRGLLRQAVRLALKVLLEESRLAVVLHNMRSLRDRLGQEAELRDCRLQGRGARRHLEVLCRPRRAQNAPYAGERAMADGHAPEVDQQVPGDLRRIDKAEPHRKAAEGIGRPDVAEGQV